MRLDAYKPKPPSEPRKIPGGLVQRCREFRDRFLSVVGHVPHDLRARARRSPRCNTVAAHVRVLLPENRLLPSANTSGGSESQAESEAQELEVEAQLEEHDGETVVHLHIVNLHHGTVVLMNEGTHEVSFRATAEVDMNVPLPHEPGEFVLEIREGDEPKATMRVTIDGGHIDLGPVEMAHHEEHGSHASGHGDHDEDHADHEHSPHAHDEHPDHGDHPHDHDKHDLHSSHSGSGHDNHHKSGHHEEDHDDSGKEHAIVHIGGHGDTDHGEPHAIHHHDSDHAGDHSKTGHSKSVGAADLFTLHFGKPVSHGQVDGNMTQLGAHRQRSMLGDVDGSHNSETPDRLNIGSLAAALTAIAGAVALFSRRENHGRKRNG